MSRRMINTNILKAKDKKVTINDTLEAGYLTDGTTVKSMSQVLAGGGGGEITPEILLENLEGSDTVVVDLNETDDKVQVRLDQDVLDEIDSKQDEIGSDTHISASYVDYGQGTVNSALGDVYGQLNGKQATIDADHPISASYVVATNTQSVQANLERIDGEVEDNRDDIDDLLEDVGDLQTAVAGKQDTISDLGTIRSGAALGATALQSVPSTYRTASVQDDLNQQYADYVDETYYKVSNPDGYQTADDVSDAIDDINYETWTFSVDNGTTVVSVTKNVLVK